MHSEDERVLRLFVRRYTMTTVLRVLWIIFQETQPASVIYARYLFGPRVRKERYG